jgi:hypothetical protein
VFGLLIVGLVLAPVALYAADRLIKMRAQARKLRRMSERLSAATARADRQEEQRQVAAKASEALTSVVPAIQRPRSSPHRLRLHDTAKSGTGPHRSVKPDHHGTPGRRATGPQRAHPVKPKAGRPNQ